MHIHWCPLLLGTLRDPYTLNESILLVSNTAHHTMILYWSHGFSRMPSAPVKIHGGLGTVCQWFLWFCASAFLVTHGDPNQIIPLSGSQNQRTGRRKYHDDSWEIFGSELLIIFSWSWLLLCLWSGASEILPVSADCRPSRFSFSSVPVNYRRLSVFRINPMVSVFWISTKWNRHANPSTHAAQDDCIFLDFPLRSLVSLWLMFGSMTTWKT